MRINCGDARKLVIFTKDLGQALGDGWHFADTVNEAMEFVRTELANTVAPSIIPVI